jgi:hypothetical protein
MKKTSIAKFAEVPEMYETENDISKERRSELSALMNQRLCFVEAHSQAVK